MSFWNYTASMKKIHQIINKKCIENKEETKMTDRRTERQQ